jgi:hypothetical protein
VYFGETVRIVPGESFVAAPQTRHSTGTGKRAQRLDLGTLGTVRSCVREHAKRPFIQPSRVASKTRIMPDSDTVNLTSIWFELASDGYFAACDREIPGEQNEDLSGS